MKCLGPLHLLQVQLEPLKRADGAHRRYDPSFLRQVDALRVTPEGVEASVNGAAVLDVHHARHPRTRQREGINGLSIGFTSHYRLLRERFGPRFQDGIAGESLVVACEAPVPLDLLSAGLEIRTATGPLRLGRVVVAEPCEPFATFALGAAPGEADPGELKAALQALRHGLRGFYVRLEGSQPATVRVGDEVWSCA